MTLTGDFRCCVLCRRLRLIKKGLQPDTMVQATIMGLIKWSHFLGTSIIMVLRRIVNPPHRTLPTAIRLRPLIMAHPLIRWAIPNTLIILSIMMVCTTPTQTVMLLLDYLHCIPVIAPIILVLRRRCLKTITITPHRLLLPVLI